MLGDPALHPLAGLDEQLLLLPAEYANPNNLVGPQGDLAPASGAASDIAVVAKVTHAIRKLCFEANLTC